MLKLKPREYQKSIFNSIMDKGSTLVVLPTGLGKTLIALMAIDDMYSKGKQSIMLAPTRPLVEQHYNSIISKTDISEDDVVMINGTIPKGQRKGLWSKKVVISTPQTYANDLENGLIEFNAGLCIFDEVHRAVGLYAYTKVAQIAKEKQCLIVGLTASPGSDRKKIQEILDNLGITNIEIRTKKDEDVIPYVQPIDFKWMFIKLPDDFKRVSNLLDAMLKDKKDFFSLWHVQGNFRSKSFLIQLKTKILKMTDKSKYILLSQFSYVFNLVHLIELVETQGSNAALQYVDKLNSRNSKATTAMFKDYRFKQAINMLKMGIEHPKLIRLEEILTDLKGQVIVFTQYVSQVELISKKLTEKGISNHLFIGQRKGFTQKKQKEIIEQFRNEKFRVLVSSSVGEEGLDIPSVDTVIFYEPIPSAIRTIQRRGRAGRVKQGQVMVLITEKTQDEIFYWSSQKKEKNMNRIVSSIASKDKSLFSRASHAGIKSKDKKGIKKGISVGGISKAGGGFRIVKKEVKTKENQSTLDDFL